MSDDDLDRDQLQKDILALYRREHEAMGEAGTAMRLDWGADMNRRWHLHDTLKRRGVLVFPHAGVADCGHQIAACVHAALDSGAETVVVISVLHAFTHEMEMARRRVAAGGDPSAEPFWGIQGPGLDGRREWEGDHALMSWRHFWQAEIARRRLNNPPRVLERYPYLAGGRPESLPGIDRLAEEVREAVIVSTADPFHHGIGYGTPADEAFYPDQEGLMKARREIEKGIEILARGDYWGYNQHCVEAKSDARDAGQVFRYLRGPMTGRVRDITYSDASELYDASPPTWVAAPLIEWLPV